MTGARQNGGGSITDVIWERKGRAATGTATAGSHIRRRIARSRLIMSLRMTVHWRSVTRINTIDLRQNRMATLG